MDNIYKYIEEYNLNNKRKILSVFDDMNADMLSSQSLNQIVTELFVRGRRLNISIVFIAQSYFSASKNIRKNSMYYFIMKNKQELQHIEFNYLSDIDSKDFINLYKKCTAKSYYVLVIGATLP